MEPDSSQHHGSVMDGTGQYIHSKRNLGNNNRPDYVDHRWWSIAALLGQKLYEPTINYKFSDSLFPYEQERDRG